MMVIYIDSNRIVLNCNARNCAIEIFVELKKSLFRNLVTMTDLLL